jgi:hypothetical protein
VRTDAPRSSRTARAHAALDHEPARQSEYREHSDADWAWKIEAVARFRANADATGTVRWRSSA